MKTDPAYRKPFFSVYRGSNKGSELVHAHSSNIIELREKKEKEITLR